MPHDPRVDYVPPQISDQKANAEAVVPSDTEDFPEVAEALLIGVGGTLRVLMLGGQTVDIEVADYAVLPLLIRRVYATGTTALSIVRVWG